jgi:hypothetical protein
MIDNPEQHREILQNIAHRVMIEKGLLPDFSPDVLAELDRIQAPAKIEGGSVRDLSGLLWCSIDNDDSRDLDQVTVAEAMPGDSARIFVAIADVDSLVRAGSAIDEHACHNTTSVYTAGEIFPMLPEKLSTDLTSLSLGEDRLANVIEMVIGPDGSLRGSDIYRARVHNQAKLAYNSVAAWLEGTGSMPEDGSAHEGLPPHPRGAEPGDDRGASCILGWSALRPRGGGEEPSEGDHRRLHGRGKRRDRSLSGLAESAFHSPSGANSQAMGPHCGACGAVRFHPA